VYTDGFKVYIYIKWKAKKITHFREVYYTKNYFEKRTMKNA